MTGARPEPCSVETRLGPDGWEVRILTPDGEVVWRRACGDEGEAALYASTVRQHLRWLSPSRFSEYYRLSVDSR